MWTKHAVIQKITPPSGVRLYQAHDQNIVWSYEQTRSPRPEEDEDLFPFLFQGNLAFSKSTAGPETIVQHREGKEVVFRDDYGIPEGFVVGVLFPPGYVPTVFKFKNKPFIPLGGRSLRNASRTPPGNFEVFLNQGTRQAAIVFVIHQPTFFGFHCIAPYLSANSFREARFSASDPLALTVAVEGPTADYQAISATDWNTYRAAFRDDANLTQLAESINELIDLLKPENLHRNSERLGAMKRTVKTTIDSIGLASSLTTILDSYHTGGVAARLVGRILAYFLL